jgi:hypothetical protein
MERALYGENAGNAFSELARSKDITEVFRSGETVIYEVPRADHAPGVLKTGTLAVFAPNPIPQQSLLTTDNQALPDVAAPGWNPVKDTVPVIVLWMLAWYLIALLGLLPALWLGAAQWPWARLIGLIILGYVLWLPVSARIMYNSTLGLGIALGLTVLDWARISTVQPYLPKLATPRGYHVSSMHCGRVATVIQNSPSSASKTGCVS